MTDNLNTVNKAHFGLSRGKASTIGRRMSPRALPSASVDCTTAAMLSIDGSTEWTRDHNSVRTRRKVHLGFLGNAAPDFYGRARRPCIFCYLMAAICSSLKYYI
jgi:hypothetical protein